MGHKRKTGIQTPMRSSSLLLEEESIPLEKHEVRPERSNWPRGVWCLLTIGFSPESLLPSLLLGLLSSL